MSLQDLLADKIKHLDALKEEIVETQRRILEETLASFDELDQLISCYPLQRCKVYIRPNSSCVHPECQSEQKTVLSVCKTSLPKHLWDKLKTHLKTIQTGEDLLVFSSLITFSEEERAVLSKYKLTFTYIVSVTSGCYNLFTDKS